MKEVGEISEIKLNYRDISEKGIKLIEKFGNSFIIKRENDSIITDENGIKYPLEVLSILETYYLIDKPEKIIIEKFPFEKLKIKFIDDNGEEMLKCGNYNGVFIINKDREINGGKIGGIIEYTRIIRGNGWVDLYEITKKWSSGRQTTSEIRDYYIDEELKYYRNSRKSSPYSYILIKKDTGFNQYMNDGYQKQ